jgi:hypothetical protein
MSHSHSDTYNNQPLPKARFTGIFIPVEILEISDLSPTEMILLSWIDALYDKEYGGCYARNEYIGKKLGLGEKHVSDLIAKLIKKDLVEKVKFDGRTRVIRACKEKWYKQEADSCKNRNLHPEITGSDSCKNRNLTYIYSKEEIKDKKREEASASKRDIFGSHVRLTKEEYDKLCEKETKPKIDEVIERINDYCQSKKPSGYSANGYAATIRNWIRRDKDTPTKTTKASVGGKRLEEYDAKW